MASGYVYLLCDANSDLYKIGVTRGSIENRLKKLQTGNGNEIHVVSYFKCSNPFRIEKVLHRYFKPQNALNEWFSLASDDVLNFKKICEKYEKVFMDYEMEKQEI